GCGRRPLPDPGDPAPHREEPRLTGESRVGRRLRRGAADPPPTHTRRLDARAGTGDPRCSGLAQRTPQGRGRRDQERCRYGRSADAGRRAACALPRARARRALLSPEPFTHPARVKHNSAMTDTALSESELAAAAAPEPGLLVFEQPLNERMRTFLRLHFLYNPAP